MHSYPLSPVEVDILFEPIRVIRRPLRQGELPYQPHPEIPNRTLCLEEFQLSAESTDGDRSKALAALTEKLVAKYAESPNATTFLLRHADHITGERLHVGTHERNHIFSVSGTFAYFKEDEELLDPMHRYVKERTHVNFGTAIEALKLGYRVQRAEGWNGKGMFLYYVPGSEFVVNRPPLSEMFPEGTTIKYQPHIDMFNAQGMCVPWAPSQSDQVAEDWVVLPRKVGDDA